jgi:CBS domain containing-hemolysin-like protein
LTLNTIAHTVGAIGSGAKATAVFGSAWFGLFSAVMTLMILFLSEIIPKTIGAVFWRHLSTPTALFVRALVIVLFPLIIISEAFTRLIARRKDLHVFSRKEFIAMARVGEEAGRIKEDESRIIRNLFRFECLKARDIMTPRTVISALRKDLTVGQALDPSSSANFSRTPIYTDSLDDIDGYVLKDDMLTAKAREGDAVTLETLGRKIKSVPENISLSSLLEFLLEGRQHIALVVDEYGGTRGLVTLEDVVETLLGMEIVDEADKVEDMQALARQQWERRARALGLDIESQVDKCDS